MTSASFEKIDYQLRYNKHIERKIIFEYLTKAQLKLNISNYRYLGFGSMWFSDFRLAHRLLHITDMISIERAEHLARAEFNQPYKAINVFGGDSTDILESIGDDLCCLPTIAWLDYDGGLSDTVVKDVDLLLNYSKVNSVIMLTVNGMKSLYRPKMTGPRKDRLDTALGQIENLLGEGTVSKVFEPKVNKLGTHADVSETIFPEFLADSILSHMVHKATISGNSVDGEAIRFIPLINFCHRDGAEMVTVGGVLTTTKLEKIWKSEIVPEHAFSETGSPLHQRLDLIPLTLKEKLFLDRCLPQPLNSFMEKVKDMGIEISEDELKKYWKYNQHFPIFFESMI